MFFLKSFQRAVAEEESEEEFNIEPMECLDAFVAGVDAPAREAARGVWGFRKVHPSMHDYGSSWDLACLPGIPGRPDSRALASCCWWAGAPVPAPRWGERRADPSNEVLGRASRPAASTRAPRGAQGSR